MLATRRSFLQRSSLFLGTALLPWQRLLALPFLQEGGQMQTLRKNVGIYTERGGTIGWLMNSEGMAIVDTQFPEQAGHLIEKIKKKTDQKIDWVINTHHHGDHSGGNIAFKEIAKNVLAHENSKINQEAVAKRRGREASQWYPTVTYKDSWSQKVGNETITLHYFGNAHTNGDSVIHFENANVAHMGDLMFNQRHPRIDRSTNASVANWIKVLGKVQKTFDDDTLFIFGHSADPDKITGGKEYLSIDQKITYVFH